MFTDEIYPSAPLQLVACELRYPTALRATRDESAEALQQQLASTFPILEIEDGTQLQLGAGGGALRQQRSYRLLSRGRTESLTMRPTAIVVETADYRGFKTFREMIARVLRTFDKVIGFTGVERIGIRYWDEVRVPHALEGPQEWAKYINSALLEPLSLTGDAGVSGFPIAVEALQGQIRYLVGEDTRVTMHYGAQPEGRVVHDSGPLRVRSVDASRPYFLIDIDSYWVAPDGFADYDYEEVLSTLDDLHFPVRAIFEASITDTLRDEVLRKEPQ